MSKSCGSKPVKRQAGGPVQAGGEVVKKATGDVWSKSINKPMSNIKEAIKDLTWKRTAPEIVESGVRSGVGKVLGGALGAVGSVLLNPTPAGAGSDKIPPRVKGGSAKGKRPYLVGENGPELFVPKQDGHIIPHDETNKLGMKVVEVDKRITRHKL